MQLGTYTEFYRGPWHEDTFGIGTGVATEMEPLCELEDRTAKIQPSEAERKPGKGLGIPRLRQEVGAAMRQQKKGNPQIPLEY